MLIRLSAASLPVTTSCTTAAADRSVRRLNTVCPFRSVHGQALPGHLQGARVGGVAADEAGGVHKHAAGDARQVGERLVAHAPPGGGHAPTVVEAAGPHRHRLDAPLLLALVLVQAEQRACVCVWERPRCKRCVAGIIGQGDTLSVSHAQLWVGLGIM